MFDVVNLTGGSLVFGEDGLFFTVAASESKNFSSGTCRTLADKSGEEIRLKLIKYRIKSNIYIA